MTDPIVVRPARYRQFGNTGRPFYLVTNADLAGAFAIDGDGEIVTADAGRRVGATLAARTADYIMSERENILAWRRGSYATPRLRHDMSPRGTRGHGVPRLKGGAAAHKVRKAAGQGGLGRLTAACG